MGKKIQFILVTLLFVGLTKALHSKEIFILPSDIVQSYQKLDANTKKLHCGGIDNFALRQLESFATSTPPKKIEGYNSRMDNEKNVPGAPDANLFFLRLSEAASAAVFADDKTAEKVAISAMKNWATNGALTETKQCYSNKGLSKSCGKAWKRKDGQDLAPTMDSGKVQAFINHASYAYFGGLDKSKTDAQTHENIKKWLNSFQSRNKKPTGIYFGYDFGWYWPAIFKKRDKNDNCFSGDCPKKLISKLINKLDEFILKDGALKDRTTRGDRALHYHNEAMAEVMITLELARKYNVNVPSSLHERIEKAGNIFVNGFFDHSYMDKWASVAHNAKFTPGKQRFKTDLNKVTYGTSWYFIFAYRYPNSDLAKNIDKVFEIGTRAAKRDLAFGIGVGCVYRALSSSR